MELIEEDFTYNPYNLVNLKKLRCHKLLNTT